MSFTTSWRAQPLSSPWAELRRQEAESLLYSDKFADEKDALARAERTERYLCERVLEREVTGRPIPAQLVRRLEKVREQIAWTLLQLEKADDDGDWDDDE